ncbi:MAG: hypothetical protein JWP69_1217 [Flaviaesturariibacter sp.]|nr:hypothetical protein [Flaviaesturariibacter sp.]
MQEEFLSLEIIWKDEHMVELEITACNKYFKGITQVYDQAECIYELAEQLIGFSGISETLFYESGKKDSYAYFSLKFYPVGTNGLIGVQINLEENVTTAFRPEEKSKLILEIIIEPSALDEFQKFLKTMAVKQSGKAQLVGRNGFKIHLIT